MAIGHEDEPSVIDDLLSIQDAINKLLLDLMVASEYTGRPRRYASGIELTEKPVVNEETGEPVIDPDTGEVVTEAVNPFPEENRMMISEAAEPIRRVARCGPQDVRIGCTRSDFAGNDGFGTSCPLRWATAGFGARLLTRLRAAEAALVARAEARQRQYGVGWEQVARLLVAIRDGVDPDRTARVVWSPADTRSQAQEADYAVKLYQSGILSRQGCPQASRLDCRRDR